MKHIVILLFALALLVSCAKDETAHIEPATRSPKTIEAVIDDSTRIELDANGKSMWRNGDRVSVFYKTTGNECYAFTGKTGSYTGALEWQSGAKREEPIDMVVGVYPYSETTTVRRDGAVRFIIPESQRYACASFGSESSPMIGKSDNSPQLHFKYATGWVRVSLTGDASIAKLVFKGNMNEPLTGLATIDDAVVFGRDYGESITLDCGGGVALVPQSPTVFIIAVAPQTFEKGFTLTAVDTRGRHMTLQTRKRITISRNTITPMTARAFVPETGKYTLSRTIPDVVPFNGGKYAVDFEADSATEHWQYRVVVGGAIATGATVITEQCAKINIELGANYGTAKRDVAVEIAPAGSSAWEKAIEVRQESALTRVGDYYWAKGNVCLRGGQFGIADGMTDRGLLFRNFSRYGVPSDNQQYQGIAYTPAAVQILLTDIPEEENYDMCATISPELRMPTFAELDNLRGAENQRVTGADGTVAMTYYNSAFRMPLHGKMGLNDGFLSSTSETMYLGLGKDNEGTGLAYIIDTEGYSFVDFDYSMNSANLGFVRCVRNTRQPAYLSHSPERVEDNSEFDLVVRTSRGDFATTYFVEVAVPTAMAPAMRKAADKEGVARFKIPANTTGENLEWAIYINGIDSGKRIVQSR